MTTKTKSNDTKKNDEDNEDDEDNDERGTCNNDIEQDDGHGHCIAVSLTDLSVWCHVCGSYIKHDTLQPVLQELQNLKWGRTTTTATTTTSSPGGNETPNKKRASAGGSNSLPTLDEDHLEEEGTDEDLDDDDMKTGGDDVKEKQSTPGNVPPADSVPVLHPSTRAVVRDVAKFIRSNECKRILVDV